MSDPRAATPNTPASWAGSGTQRPHVLIVTADEDLKQFLGEGLVYGGFWTSTVASAVQALEVFRLRSFDLALVDAALGGIGAAEMIRRLRGRSDRAGADTPRTDVPILLVADDPGRAGPAAEEADAALAAPLDLEDLVPHLHGVFAAWQRAHPGRPMADEVALRHDPATADASGTVP